MSSEDILDGLSGFGKFAAEPVKAIIKFAKTGYIVGKATGKIVQETTKGIAKGVEAVGKAIIEK